MSWKALAQILNKVYDADSGALKMTAAVQTGSYTPAWTTPGNAPAIGDGTLTGKYIKIGKLVVATVNLVGGASTDWAASQGAWSFSLPFEAASTRFCGSGFILDNGTAFKNVSCRNGTTTTMQAIHGSDGNTINAGSPMTWATGDTLDLTLVYEAAE